MKFLEKNLENIIFETDFETLDDHGLYIPYYKKKRQLNIGNYGIADLVYFQRLPAGEPCPEYMQIGYNICDDCLNQRCRITERINITVVELKQDEIGVKAFLQALRYAKGISRYIEGRKLFRRLDVNYSLKLIGSKLDDSSLIYMADFVSEKLSVEIYTYSFGISGLHFKKEEGYSLINEGF